LTSFKIWSNLGPLEAEDLRSFVIGDKISWPGCLTRLSLGYIELPWEDDSEVAPKVDQSLVLLSRLLLSCPLLEELSLGFDPDCHGYCDDEADRVHAMPILHDSLLLLAPKLTKLQLEEPIVVGHDDDVEILSQVLSQCVLLKAFHFIRCSAFTDRHTGRYTFEEGGDDNDAGVVVDGANCPSLASLLVDSGVSYHLQHLSITWMSVMGKGVERLGMAMQQEVFPLLHSFIFSDNPGSYVPMEESFYHEIETRVEGVEAILLLGLVCCDHLDELVLSSLFWNFWCEPRSRDSRTTMAIWTGAMAKILPRLRVLHAGGPYLFSWLHTDGGLGMSIATNMTDLRLHLRWVCKGSVAALGAGVANMKHLRHLELDMNCSIFLPSHDKSSEGVNSVEEEETCVLIERLGECCPQLMSLSLTCWRSSSGSGGEGEDNSQCIWKAICDQMVAGAWP